MSVGIIDIHSRIVLHRLLFGIDKISLKFYFDVDILYKTMNVRNEETYLLIIEDFGFVQHLMHPLHDDAVFLVKIFLDERSFQQGPHNVNQLQI